jgi:hypothetical protein
VVASQGLDIVAEAWAQASAQALDTVLLLELMELVEAEFQVLVLAQVEAQAQNMFHLSV